MLFRSQTGGNRNISSAGGTMMPYTVGTDGNINFPMIGKIQVQGLTRRQCEDNTRIMR